MFRVCSALLLVCVCVFGVCVSADLPRDFGVKLCGREFIRAVIFTCGGSRWRRADTPRGDAWLDAHQESADGASSTGDLETGAPLSSLSSLLQVMTDGRGRESRDGLSAWLQTLFSSRDAGAPGLIWPLPDRRKRNFSVGLAGMCCNQGCTKNDIGRLC